ncbi:MAG: SpoIID/LytB domain-containing protein [Acidimicrobiia bacterium]|nr:SpoIID/LytB domain-containing protein [Acidimicrobiia bacterium]
MVSTIDVSGHGYGHGRGMGQYGALGYSLAPFNWTSDRILQHFYSNTTAGNVGNGLIDVVLSAPGATTSTGMSGATIVRLDRGTPRVSVGGGPAIGAPAQAVRIVRTGNNAFEISYGAGCTGPWNPAPGASAERVAVLPAVASGDLADTLQVCDGAMTGGNPADRRWVRGEVQARSTSERQYTVNVVPLDAYLRGVVPRESPASWPAAALQAQAVAARSYALADARSRTPGTYPWVATCDTVSCQVYGGRQQERGGSITGEVASTDSAIAATTGRVRLLGGAIARTEFSSSTGGWSAGGTFPAVQDLGDATPSNTRHNWQVALDRARIEASFNRGALQSLAVTKRNGLGADGGRVLEVTLVFTGGTVVVSGNDFRIRFGLFSDWFSFRDREADRRYVAKGYLDLLGRPGDDAGLDHWTEVVGRQGRQAFTRGLVFSSSCEWPRRVVNDLYVDILGRPADPGGLAFWSGRICRGEPARLIASLIYGSTEYFNDPAQGGGTPEGFVRSLYNDILGRPNPSTGEVDFWVAEVRRRGVPAVAADFYQSLESRERRVRRQFDVLLRRPPDPAGLDYWAGELLRVDDLVLTIELTASDEYYLTA